MNNLSSYVQGQGYKTLREYGLSKISFAFKDFTPESINILDVACGEGSFTRDVFTFFKEEKKVKNTKIYGVDISTLHLNYAESFNSSKEIGYLVENAQEGLPFKDGYFDVLICTAAIKDFGTEYAISEMLRVLKSGGFLLVWDSSIGNVSYPSSNVWAKIRKTFVNKEDRWNMQDCISLFEKEGFNLSVEDFEIKESVFGDGYSGFYMAKEMMNRLKEPRYLHFALKNGLSNSEIDEWYASLHNTASYEYSYLRTVFYGKKP